MVEEGGNEGWISYFSNQSNRCGGGGAFVYAFSTKDTYLSIKHPDRMK